MRLFEKKKISVLIVPFIVSLTGTYILTRGIIKTTPHVFGIRSVLFSFVLFIIWLCSLTVHQRRIIKKDSQIAYFEVNPIVLIVISVIISLFLVNTAWGSGYLSLEPYSKIDNGTQCVDTLFHGSIAESFSRSMRSSTLANSERYMAYHTFSHFLLGTVAKLIKMPSLIVYNYLFPVIFAPLICFAILLAVVFAKEFFSGRSSLGFVDLVVISLYFFGISKSISEYAVWKNCYVVSESFLVSSVFAAFFYSASFYFLKRMKTNPRLFRYYCVIAIPLEIFIVSWAKISEGIIFAAGIMYVVFRNNMKSLKNWALIILYFMAFFVSALIFTSVGMPSTKGAASYTKFRLFYQGVYCDGKMGIWGFYFVLSIMMIMFIFLDVIKNKYKWEDVKTGRTIWIETIIVIAIVAFSPSTFIDIDSPSNMYFAYALELPALIFLLGHDLIDIEENSKGNIKSIIYVSGFIWCIWMGINNCPSNPIKNIEDTHYSNLSRMLLGIREEVGEEPEKYTIYLEEDSLPAKVFEDSKSAIYVVPSMTGVGVINASYRDNGVCYTFSGEEVSHFGLGAVDNNYLSYNESLVVAKERGKEKLIHIKHDGYEIVDL